jgi:hypothetical protein
MNLFSQFSAFYEVVAVDNRLKHYHISLYITILHFWNKNRYGEDIILHRETTLNHSKIGSSHTYYNSLRNLHDWGYIEYFPKKIGENVTKIRLILFEYSEADFLFFEELCGANMHRADADMHSVLQKDGAFMHSNGADMLSVGANMHPLSAYMHRTGCISATQYKVIKYLKDIKSILKEKNEKIIFSQNAIQSPLNFIPNEEKKRTEKRKKVASKKESDFSDFPTQNEIIVFFESNNSNSETARKFYNYYSAIGWVTKSNVPIADWTFAAKTWISNERVNSSNTKTNYDEAF